MVLLFFLCVFCLFLGLEKKYRTKRKEILGVEMGLHCSCFQFRVSVFIHDCTNRYFTYRKFTKLVFSTTSSTLVSVGTPTEGKLGLVREKRGGREVGIIAIAYPDLLWVGGREKKSGSL